MAARKTCAACLSPAYVITLSQPHVQHQLTRLLGASTSFSSTTPLDAASFLSNTDGVLLGPGPGMLKAVAHGCAYTSEANERWMV